LDQAIQSDLPTYMHMPEKALVMHRKCGLSGSRYDIVFKLDVVGALCGKEVLHYEAYYSGAWPVDGTRVRLERVGRNFERLLKQKRDKLEHPSLIPRCPE